MGSRPAGSGRPTPSAGAGGGVHEPRDNPEHGTTSDEETDEPPDFSGEVIRRAVLARWEYRPAGIRYARWEEMLASFAERMAARVHDEDQRTPSEPADQPPGGAGESATDTGADSGDDDNPDHTIAKEPSARSSDGAGSGSEPVERRPADLTLGRRGPESRSDDAVSSPQQKRQKQNEHEAPSAQASLGNSPPPRELIARGGGVE